MKKMLLYKIIIITLGVLSIICLYTGDIYMYENLSIKFLSPVLWCGIILWFLFLINASVLTIKINKNEKDKYLKIRNIVRNIVLLILMTVLLIYKIGNGVLSLYKMSNKVFNNWIYVIFALTFIICLVINIMVNHREDTVKKDKNNK